MKSALFCFPRLVFDGDSSWTGSGVTDLRYLPMQIMKHEQSTKQITDSEIYLSSFGKLSNAAQIDSAYELSISKTMNWRKGNWISKIINCKKCG